MIRTIYSLKNIFLFILFTLSATFSTQLTAQCDPVSDSLALVAFYNTTEANLTNWLVAGQPIDNWEGIGVNASGCVTSIELHYHIMSGVLLSELGNLPYLERIELDYNHIGGSIPLELGGLSNLKVLNLTETDITGTIPAELGNLSNLESLLLRNNYLTGSIPPELGNLPDLVNLSVGYNDLTGIIPPELGNLSNLTGLSLGSNALTGIIPPELGSLSNLWFLYIEANDLIGIIPPELGGLSNLEVMWLGSNELTGSIPPELGSLSVLRELKLGGNELTGTIPPELGNLSNLSTLELNFNELTGNIPPELGSISNLWSLWLNGNELTGNIPPELGNLSDLGELSLSGNELTGSIPPELGSLSNLQELYLNGNELTGSIPPELGNLPSLSFYGLSISLSHNELTGSIPYELGNIPNLSSLHLSENSLTGELPIGLASYAFDLDVSANQLSGCIPPQYEIFCGTQSSFINNPELPNNGDFAAFCIIGEGACDPNIFGQITFDDNQNCEIDDGELNFQNWIIKASSLNGDTYGVSDENGEYHIYTNPGEYTIELFPAGPYWEENCTGITTVNVTDLMEIDTINFSPNAVIDCPHLTVDISTPFLRRCFSNIYTVNYCNNGTVLAENAYIEIQLDDLIEIDSTSVPISSQTDNILIFDIGDVAVDECGSFSISTFISCDAVLTQTLCATAHIYPDSICVPPPPEWSGATVAVKGTCEGEVVRFEISNIGDENMEEISSYVVIEDILILLEEPETFILDSGEAFEVEFPANGSTYICQAMQVAGHPNSSMPMAFVEGCGTNESSGFSTGFVTQFPEDDNVPFVSIDCQEVIGSFDPNDKNGYPKGYGEEYFIEKNQDIEYHIRFQNTGTDTAFTVVVEDAISPNLDLTTLRFGASSHAYRAEIREGAKLQFVFENILLVDSFANEAASHGFVKFKISQKEDLMIGTQIRNTASIFFDFNEAVITNTTLHTIGEDFVEIVATEQPFIPNLKVFLAPNPVINEATIRLSGVEFKNAQLFLFNTVGVLIKQERFIGNEFVLKRGDLPAGIYFFEITVDNKKGFVGKLMVQ